MSLVSIVDGGRRCRRRRLSVADLGGKALEELGNISERSIIKIIEIMPKNHMTLRQILASERKSYTDEEVNKILALTKEK